MRHTKLRNLISKAVQGTQVLVYTNTLFLYFSKFPLFFKETWNIKWSIKTNIQKLEVHMLEEGREENHSKETTPRFWRRNSKFLQSKGFMKRSAFWSSVWMNSRVRMSSSTNSWIKWCQIAMCLVRECWTEFLEMLMALVLSQYIVRCIWQIP